MKLQFNIQKNTDKRRWIAMLGGTVVMIMLAWSYTWSVIYDPMVTERGISTTTMDLIYSVTAIVSAVVTLVGGKLTDKLGSTHVLFGCIISFAVGQFICGFFGSALGFWIGNMIQIWPMAVIMISVGANTMKLFPDWKGLSQGIVGLGISIGGAFIAPLCQYCIDTIGLSKMFYVTGALFTVVGLIGLFFFPNCPEGYLPKGYSQEDEEENEEVRKGGVMNPDFVQKDWKGMIRDWTFYPLMMIPLLGMTMYMLLSYQMARIAKEMLGIEPMKAAFLVSVVSIVDFIVIIVCPVSDKLGRLSTTFVLFAVGFVSSIMFIFSPAFGVGYFTVCTVLYCCSMGAFGFIHMTMASDLWGSQNFGLNGSIIYLPVLLSSTISPWFLQICQNADGSTNYTELFIIAAAMCGAGMVLAFILWRVKRFKIEVFPPAVARKMEKLKKKEKEKAA